MPPPWTLCRRPIVEPGPSCAADPAAAACGSCRGRGPRTDRVAHRPLDGAHNAPPTGSTGPATSSRSPRTTNGWKNQNHRGGGKLNRPKGGKLGVLLTTRKSWSRTRRVVGKAEHLPDKANPRFVVTSLAPESWDPRALYEDLYCARGDMENRIKEQQLHLFADRTSAATMRANQIRLYFSSVAYLLLQALRRLGLAGTALARAQCDTIRLKLLKIGAQVRVTVRKVWVSLASGSPYASLFARVYANLHAAPLR